MSVWVMGIEQTLKKVDQDIASGDLGKARDRLHGLIATYPNALSLRRKLGEIYWKLRDPAMAGRYWYLEEEKTIEMIAACGSFERYCGRDAVLMLKAMRFRGDPDAIADSFAGATLRHLRQRVREERRLWLRDDPLIPKRVRDRTLGAGLVIALVGVVALAIIGLVTILKWTVG